MPTNLFPGPVDSIVTLTKDFSPGDVLPHLAITLLRLIRGLALAMAIDVSRPRGFDGPAVFDINRDVIRRFLALAKMKSEPVAAFSP